MFNRNILLLFLLFVPGLSCKLFAQIKNPGVISGRIMDKESLTPLEYANILLLDSIKGILVTGVVSDSNGFFRMTNVPVGKFFLEYSYIGYEKKRTKSIVIDRKNFRKDLGSLLLESSQVNMDEVSITAEKSMMINKIDRKIFNVQKEISAQTGTVTDVLQTIPSVSVDMDGNITLRGSGSVTILINGRPSLMSNSATLEQMPASLVERIEVITNPSAKYKPDGTAGIINIVLKKERKAGFNGILGANAGNKDRYNTNLQLNLNTGTVNLFGSYGFRQDHRIRKGELQSQTIDTSANQSSYYFQNSEGSSMARSHLGQLGIDWTINKKDVAGISGTYNYRDVERNEVSANMYKNNDLVPTEAYTRIMTGVEQENSYGITTYFEHAFNKEEEHRLRADLEYQNDLEAEHNDYRSTYKIPCDSVGFDRTNGENRDQNINLSINYTRPFWKNSEFEAGYEGNIQVTDQDTRVEHYDTVDGVHWWYDPEASNQFHATQTVHAIFTTLGNSWGKFSIMGGLRAEEALVNLEFISADSNASNNYFALYPTLHMSLSSGKNEWQLNYSRRVNRPDVEDMNPVPEYRDPRNIFVGNPELKPEDIHSVEIGYAVQTEYLNLIPTLFYRYKVNGFTMVTTSLNDTVMQTTIDNLATDQSAGIDLSGTLKIGKVVNINFGASGYYSQIDASNIGYSNNRSTFAWNSKMNASFSISKTTLLQVNTQYRSEVLTAQGIRRPSWWMNLGFRQDFWQKRVSLLFTISDLFNTQVNKTLTDTENLVQESERRRDGQVFYGGLIFNFGSKDKKTKDVKLEFDNRMEN